MTFIYSIIKVKFGISHCAFMVKNKLWSTGNGRGCFSHRPDLICQKVEQVFIVSQECSAVKFLQQRRNEEHHIFHHRSHLPLRPVALTVLEIKKKKTIKGQNPCVFLFFNTRGAMGRVWACVCVYLAFCYPVKWDECSFAHLHSVCGWCPWQTPAVQCGKSVSAPPTPHQGKPGRWNSSKWLK